MLNVSTMDKQCIVLLAFFCFSSFPLTVSAQSGEKEMKNAAFTVVADRFGLGSLMKTNDVHATNYIRRGQVFGEMVVRYIHERKSDSLKASTASKTTFINEDALIFHGELKSRLLV